MKVAGRLLSLAALVATPAIGGPSGCEPSVAAEDLSQLALSSFHCSPSDPCAAEQLAKVKALAALHPDDLHVAVRLMASTLFSMGSDPAAERAFRGEIAARHRDHPDDLLAAYLDALALSGGDIGERLAAVDAFDTLVARHPGFTLGRVGRLQARMAQCGDTIEPEDRLELESLAGCPAALHTVLWIASVDRDTGPDRPPPFWAPRAPFLRAVWEAAPAADRLVTARALWELEFRTTPPEEQAKVRARVFDDIARLSAEIESRFGESYGLLLLLQSGSELAGDEAGAKRFGDRIAARYPCTRKGMDLLFATWPKESLEGHPEHEIQRLIAQAESWIEKCPDKPELEILRFDAVRELPSLDDARVRTEVERAIKAWERWKGSVKMGRSPITRRLASF
ncbi:MAG: hypothetical protein U0166_10765 [Acidobacteriota bacterium]